jgi:hypothetical protein
MWTGCAEAIKKLGADRLWPRPGRSIFLWGLAVVLHLPFFAIAIWRHRFSVCWVRVVVVLALRGTLSSIIPAALAALERVCVSFWCGHRRNIFLKRRGGLIRPSERTRKAKGRKRYSLSSRRGRLMYPFSC